MTDVKRTGLYYRTEGHEMVDVPCRKCGTNVPTKRYKEKLHLKKGGNLCKKCCSILSSETMKRTQAATDPATRSARAKINGSMADKSQSVNKQWDTIRASPDLYKENCKNRSERMKKVWLEYGDEQKNYIVKSLIAANGKARSGISDKLKQHMIASGLVGFESEIAISGFIADEVDETNKVVVELYGDLYHCNPRKYKDENVFINAIKRTVGEQWLRDRRRLGCFYKNGYTVVVIWEYDFRHHPELEVQRIKDEIDRKTSSSRIP